MAHDSTNDGPVDTIVCPRCGAENLQYASFCLSCGLSFGEGEDDLQAEDLLDRGSTSLDGEHLSAYRSPRVSPARLRLLEAGAGLVLLLLVVGYALLNWQQTNMQSSAYHDGLSAEQSKDWDRAVSSFEAAGSILDAPRHLANAGDKVHQRDTLYLQAQLAEKQGDWKGAASKLEQLQAIQPSFADTGALLAKARTEAFNSGLEGLVYLVKGGPNPGLYIRDAGGQAALIPGSDGKSLVRAISPDGRALAYDRPAQRDEACPSTSNRGDAGTQPRMAVLLTVDSGRVRSERALPCVDSEGKGTFGAHGLWWSNPPIGPDPTRYEVFYQDSSPGAPLERVSDAESGKLVVAFDPSRSRVALAQPSAYLPGDYWQSDMYLAGPAGLQPRLLVTVVGQVTDASFSADGRWLLFAAQQNSSNYQRSLLALRLPDEGKDASTNSQANPQMVMRVLDTTFRTATRPPESSAATLLNTSFGEDWAALVREGGQEESLQLFDLDEGRVAYKWSRPDPGADNPQLAGVSPDGRYLAITRSQEQGQEQRASLAILNLDPGAGTWSEMPVNEQPGQSVRAEFVPGSDYVASTVTNPIRGAGVEGVPRTTSSLYVAQMSKQGLAAMRLVSRTALAEIDGAPPTALFARSGMVAYIAPGGDLHATYLDGSGDTRLAGGVSGVWSLP